jgi:hypothetical protein
LNSNLEKTSSKGILGGILLGSLFLGLLASRRWQQWVAPEIWCEDAWVLAGFIRTGWHEFLLPLNGYLILMPKLITAISMEVSISHYPFVSTVLAVAFSTFVGMAVAYSPIRVSGKALCAISIFAIPSDPEVFDLPLYTLWWTAILLIICALWDERVPGRFIRSLFVIIGGLSSPFVFVVLPVFYFRAYYYRTFRTEKTVAITATVVSAIQFPFVFLGATKSIPPASSIWHNAIPKFCGWFVLGNFSRAVFLLWTAGVAVLVAAAILLFFRRRDPSAWILVGLYLGAIGSSIARVDPAVLVPSQAGPRYFFLPFVLTFWILIQLCTSTRLNWIRFAAAIISLAAVLNAIPVWSRGHRDMQWSDNLRSSRLFPTYWIKVQYDGSLNSGFFVVASGSDWDAAIRNDRFLTRSDLQSAATFAYRVVDRSETDQIGAPSISSSRIVAGSHETLLRLHAGDRVRFRSGAVARPQNMEIVGLEGKFISRLPIAADWVTLEFSNSRLPHEFTLKVVDQGQGVGEWSPTDNSF